MENVSSAAVADRRRAAPRRDIGLIYQRTLPAMYIVDAELRVRHSHVDGGDARERRRDHQLRLHSSELPEPVFSGARFILATAPKLPASVLIEPFYLVRVIALEGPPDSDPAFAVIVEHCRGRDYVRSARERFKLSRRETEVLELLIDGARTTDIAKSLAIAPSTVVFHVRRLMEKTRARRRTELIFKAMT